MTSRPRRAGPAQGEAGFTIIELAVTILIIVVVVGGLALGLGSLRRADLTAVSGRIDATARYLYQIAAINATPYRLVIDLDAGSWKVEALEEEATACHVFTVKDVRKKDTASLSEKKAERKGRFGDSKKKGKDGEEDGDTCSLEEQDADGNCPVRGFVEVPDHLLKERKLPAGIKFTGLMTTHQQDVAQEGKGYVYFFPNGTAEKAYIYLSSDAETFTIETFPLLGKVKVHHEKLDLRGVLRDEDE